MSCKIGIVSGWGNNTKQTNSVGKQQGNSRDFEPEGEGEAHHASTIVRIVLVAKDLDWVGKAAFAEF